MADDDEELRNGVYVLNGVVCNDLCEWIPQERDLLDHGLAFSIRTMNRKFSVFIPLSLELMSNVNVKLWPLAQPEFSYQTVFSQELESPLFGCRQQEKCSQFRIH